MGSNLGTFLALGMRRTRGRQLFLHVERTTVMFRRLMRVFFYMQIFSSAQRLAVARLLSQKKKASDERQRSHIIITLSSPPSQVRLRMS
jgi:hypothetical protein